MSLQAASAAIRPEKSSVLIATRLDLAIKMLNETCSRLSASSDLALGERPPVPDRVEPKPQRSVHSGKFGEIFDLLDRLDSVCSQLNSEAGRVETI